MQLVLLPLMTKGDAHDMTAVVLQVRTLAPNFEVHGVGLMPSQKLPCGQATHFPPTRARFGPHTQP
jgi:hypothetical protein